LSRALALAHHSFVAEFDAKRAVTLHGVLTKVEWSNPHAHFYVDVRTRAERWPLEPGTPQPNALRRLGWTRDFLQVGGEVTVLGVLAKDGSKMASAKSVTLADGRKWCPDRRHPSK